MDEEVSTRDDVSSIRNTIPPDGNYTTSLRDTEVTFLPDIHCRDEFLTITLSRTMVEITTGVYKDVIEQAREKLQAGDEEGYTHAKRSLPTYIFSGTFRGKAVAANFSVPSGVRILDADKLSKHNETPESVKARLAHDNSIAAVFTSPSGDGVKIIVRVSTVKDAAESKAEFRKIEAYFQEKHGIVLDETGKDIARLCFTSYDPDAYINYAAEEIDLSGFEAMSKSPVTKGMLGSDLDSDDEPVPDGSRNSELTRKAGQVRGKGGGLDEVLSVIREVNAKRCVPPLGDDELITIATSVCNYPTNAEKEFKAARSVGLVDTTEAGLAELLRDSSEGKLRFLVELGLFVVFLIGIRRWEVDSTGEITVEKLNEFLGCLRKAAEGNKNATLLVDRVTSRTRLERGERALLTMTKTRPGIPIRLSEFDKDPNFFQVGNGVVDLRDGSFREVAAEDFLLKKTDVDYVEGADCPEFKKFILWAMGSDMEKVQFLQRYLGYLLFGHAQEEVLLIFHGHGANGKSTLREIIRMVMGDYATIAEPGIIVNRKSGDKNFGLARLAGVRAVLVSETDMNDSLAEASVKYIVQQEEIVAEEKFKNPFTFKPVFKPLLATNNLPNVRGGDLGIWRRLLLVTFDQTLGEGERDVHFVTDKLEPELSGILNWMIEGAIEYHGCGLCIPESIRRATAAYRETSDIFKMFITDSIEQKAGGFVSCADVKTRMEEWYRSNTGEDELPRFVNPNTLGRAMSAAGYKRKKIGGVWGYQDVELKKVEHKTGGKF